MVVVVLSMAEEVGVRAVGVCQKRTRKGFLSLCRGLFVILRCRWYAGKAERGVRDKRTSKPWPCPRAVGGRGREGGRSSGMLLSLVILLARPSSGCSGDVGQKERSEAHRR